jgi:secreted trypsin-like serine protease
MKWICLKFRFITRYVLTAAHCYFFKAEIKLDEYEVLTHAFLLDQIVAKGADKVAALG